MWESIQPITSSKSDAEKLSWISNAINTTVSLNVLKYTDFEWTVHSSDNNYDPLYPQRDHTLNMLSGNYLLLRAVQPRQVYDRAIVVSDHFKITPQNRSLCLKFFYYITYQTFGQFSHLEIYQAENINTIKKIGQISSSLSPNQWTLYNITARALNSSSTNMWFYLVLNIYLIINSLAIILIEYINYNYTVYIKIIAL